VRWIVKVAIQGVDHYARTHAGRHNKWVEYVEDRRKATLFKSRQRASSLALRMKQIGLDALLEPVPGTGTG